jgi:hypothetical protein
MRRTASISMREQHVIGLRHHALELQLTDDGERVDVILNPEQREHAGHRGGGVVGGRSVDDREDATEKAERRLPALFAGHDELMRRVSKAVYTPAKGY